MAERTRVLLIGGTGPTGPAIARGLEARGFDVTILHSGNHEVPEVDHLRHLHGDVFSDDGLRSVLGAETFDVTIANYGRLRSIADVMVGRTGRILSIGGVPVYRGFFEPAVHRPPGLPIPTREDALLATEADDGKSYRIGRTEELLFERHPTATHFRYPYVYGPRQLAPREWCVVRRILDQRPFLILPDDGLSLIPFGYVDNLAHAMLLAIDQPEASMGEIFNCGDDEKLTIRQVAEIITDELVSRLGVAFAARPVCTAGAAAHDELPHHPSSDGHRQAAGATRLSRCCPSSRSGACGNKVARRATRQNGAATRKPRLQDPFDYGAEDRLAAWWRSATAGSNRSISAMPSCPATASPTPALALATFELIRASDLASPATVRLWQPAPTPRAIESKPMSLHGWSLPLSPSGAASLVPAPPWHFSGDALGIDYRGDP